MTKSVIDVREFSDARDLHAAIGLLLDCVDKHSTVPFEVGLAPKPLTVGHGAAALVEETLSDGSKVHNIAICLPNDDLTPTDTTKPFTAGGHLIEVERQIIERLVIDILAARRSISVFDGEAFELRASTDKDAIMAAIGHADETKLFVHLEGDKAIEGWVLLIHGNNCDVISDNTVNIDHLLKGAEEFAERFQ